MDCRRFLLTSLAGAVAVPLAVDAQQQQRLYRIGILDRTSTAINAANLNAFRQGLRELGYIEGKDFAIEYRSVDGQGVVASLARPGGNVTGLTAVVTELYAKRVELLRELVPRAARIAVLFNMSNPAVPPQWKEVETAGVRWRDQAPY